MIGCQDFCGHYDWTFEYLHREYGDEALHDYWEQAISRDSQRHARPHQRQGLPGDVRYWGHTLVEEEAGYIATEAEGLYASICIGAPRLVSPGARAAALPRLLRALHGVDRADHGRERLLHRPCP